MGEWATYLLEIRSREEDWRAAFERESGWDLDDGLILERYFDASERDRTGRDAWNAYREPVGLFEVREIDATRRTYDGPFWDEPACPFVGPPRALLAFTMESSPLARRFGYDAGRAARGFVLDLGPPNARRPTPCVHRSVDETVALIDLDRLRGYGASRGAIHGVLKHHSDILVFEDGPYLDYVVGLLADLAKRSDARSDSTLLSMWRYTSSFTGGSECYLFA